jgi:hypothetical protein
MKLILSVLAIAFYLTPALAQQAAINFTAKSANVSEAGTPVRINLLRWSTDAERDALVAAFSSPGAAGAGDRGRGRGGLDPNDPANADVDGGGAGRGARGRGRGGAPAAPPSPTASLTGAIGKATTIGYIWTNEVVGYSVKYAFHAPLPNGGERLVLAVDRRLGGVTPSWKLKDASTSTDYEFTLLEFRLDAKGAGEGKTSLTTKVVVDNDAKTLALENYSATPAMLASVARQ